MASASRPSTNSEILGFADFKLDVRAGELHRNGSMVRMQRQPFQVLTHLAEHAGEIVTRDELRQLLWPADTFVDFDNSLSAAINKVREALGDSTDDPRFIETLPRRGYRFIAVVNGTSSGPQTAIQAESLAASVGDSSILPPARSRRKKWIIIAAAGAVTLAAMAVIGGRVLRKTSPPVEAQLEQITSNAAELPITGSAISPDGKYLAYSDSAGTYLRIVSTGEMHAMPLPAGLELRPDAWLPDSANFLATQYSSSRPAEEPSLWLVPVVGAPRKLLDNAFAAAVSPDASRIAFVRGPLNVSTQGGREIWVMNIDGSTPHLLAKGDLTAWLGSVTWSPDSRRVAYIRAPHWASDSPETTSIQVQFPESRKASALLSDPKMGNALLWAPDGRIVYTLADSTKWGIAFSSFASTSYDIWGIPVNTSTAKPAGPSVLIAHASGEVSRLSMAESTGTLAFVNEVKQMDAYISELAEGGGSATPPRRLTLSDANDVPFAWTADSRSIIFISDRNRYVNIYRQDIDQTTAELVVGGKVNAWTPRATPDSQHLVYLVNPREQEANWTGTANSDWPTHIMEVPIAGGLPKRVLTGDHIGDLNCSKSGCVYVTVHSEVAYVAFDADTGRSHEILRLPIDRPGCCGWHLSPDGRTIALTGPPASGRFILFSLDDKTFREVVISNWSQLGSTQEPVLSGFDWAADGKGLFLSVDMKPSGLGLVYVDLEGLARVLLKGGNIRWAIPSPDGRYLALHTFSTVRNIWFVKLPSALRD